MERYTGTICAISVTLESIVNYLIILFTAFLLVGCEKKTDSNNDTKAEVIRNVKYLTTTRTSFIIERELAGVVQSTRTSPLSFKVGGTVSDILIAKGNRVKKGQVLARLETDELELTIGKASASLGAAQAALVQAEDKYSRAEKLQLKGFVSDSELLNIKADFDAKNQQMLSAQIDLRNAKLNLSRTELIAPYAGLISHVMIDDFTKVNSGQKVLELVNNNSLEVAVLVPESLIQYFSFGMGVTIEIPALDDLQVSGELTEIGAVVEKGNAYSVTVRILESNNKIRNGMSANVMVTLGNEDPTAIVLPLSAVNFDDISAAREEKKAAIYVVNPMTMTLEKRYVATERTLDNKFKVYDGLVEGEHVVIAGVPFLFEGQKVQLWQEK
jgi:RND family efflux transporter MFP subunit